MLPRTAAFFDVGLEGDLSTTRSSQMLVEPLRAWVVDDQKSWNVTGIPPAEAFLFAATHGMGSSLNWSRQESDTGAYIRQEWSGAAWNSNPRPFRFAGKDLTDDKNPSGMIAIFFACYSAGMPKMKEFRQKDSLIGDPAVRMAVA